MVAAGFVLRLIAGAVAVDVPISVWFFIVGSFGSLFMVAGKRHAEHLDLGVERAGHRATLSEYSLEYLGYVRSVASGVAMVGYCLWAFEKSTGQGGRPLVRALDRPVRPRDAALRAARRARRGRRARGARAARPPAPGHGRALGRSSSGSVSMSPDPARRAPGRRPAPRRLGRHRAEPRARRHPARRQRRRPPARRRAAARRDRARPRPLVRRRRR